MFLYLVFFLLFQALNGFLENQMNQPKTNLSQIIAVTIHIVTIMNAELFKKIAPKAYYGK